MSEIEEPVNENLDQGVEQAAHEATKKAAPEVVKGPTLEEQLVEAKDQRLRALAELENVRRRSEKEREDTSKFAVTNFARDMLTVADNFKRALEAVPAQHTENETLKNLRTGVEATERQMLAAFERYGIKEIASLGQPFDPNFHRVMMEVEDASKPAGMVVQVMQAGYMIHDRLLREALVAVSKGGEVAHKVDTQA